MTSETGAQTGVSYYPVSLSTCNPGVSPAAPPSPSANQWPCFPQKWTQGDLGGTGATTTSWFHKYLVSQVQTTDATGSNPPLVTSYQYCNDPSCSAPLTGAAWHYDTDIDLVPAKDKSWSQWRGFGYVRQTAGAAGGTQSQTRYTFLRGMDGDPAPKSGGGFTYPAVTVAPSRASTSFPAAVTDAAALNGFTLETIVMDGPGGAQASDTVNYPWVSRATATSGPQPWGQPLTAVMTGTAETDTYTPLSAHAGGGTRQVQVKTSHDGDTGLVTQVADLGDVTDSSQARCTRYSYPAAPSPAGLLNYPTQVTTTSGFCSAASPPLVSDTKLSYDGQAWGTAPTSGNVSETDVYSSGDGTGAHWVLKSRDSYDSYGRLTSSQGPPPGGFTTTYAYASAYGTGRPTTQVTVTSPLTASSTQTTVTDVNPNWGVPDDTIDASRNRTDYAYDPLGRVTAVWGPARPARPAPARPGRPTRRATATPATSTPTRWRRPGRRSLPRP